MALVSEASKTTDVLKASRTFAHDSIDCLVSFSPGSKHGGDLEVATGVGVALQHDGGKPNGLVPSFAVSVHKARHSTRVAEEPSHSEGILVVAVEHACFAKAREQHQQADAPGRRWEIAKMWSSIT